MAMDQFVNDYIDYEVNTMRRKPIHLYEHTLRTMEVALLNDVLKRTEGNQSTAAILLGITRGSLRKKIREHKIKITYTPVQVDQTEVQSCPDLAAK